MAHMAVLRLFFRASCTAPLCLPARLFADLSLGLGISLAECHGRGIADESSSPSRTRGPSIFADGSSIAIRSPLTGGNPPDKILQHHMAVFSKSVEHHHLCTRSILRLIRIMFAEERAPTQKARCTQSYKAGVSSKGSADKKVRSASCSGRDTVDFSCRSPGRNPSRSPAHSGSGKRYVHSAVFESGNRSGNGEIGLACACRPSKKNELVIKKSVYGLNLAVATRHDLASACVQRSAPGLICAVYCVCVRLLIEDKARSSFDFSDGDSKPTIGALIERFEDLGSSIPRLAWAEERNMVAAR